MANYEVKFLDGSSARVRSLRRAAELAYGVPFVARKLLRKNRKTTWAKFIFKQGRIHCLAKQNNEKEGPE